MEEILMKYVADDYKKDGIISEVEYDNFIKVLNSDMNLASSLLHGFNQRVAKKNKNKKTKN